MNNSPETEPPTSPSNSGKNVGKCPKCGAILEEVAENPSLLHFCPICGVDLRAKKGGIKVHPASFWVRLGAWLIDVIIIGIVFYLVFDVILRYPFEANIPAYLQNLDERFPGLPLQIVRGNIMNGITFLYFLTVELLLEGQTLGKLLVGYRKVNRKTLQTQRRIGWIFLDSIFKTLSIFLLIDLIAGLFNPGPEKYYRWTQKKEQAVIIRKISLERVVKKQEA